MKIEFLYFEGCPSYKIAFQYLKEVLEEENIKAEIKKIKVNSEEEAKRLKFLGSPSIRINGKDLEQKSQDSKDFGMKCRIYFEGGKIQGWPSKEKIRKAILEAKGG